MSGGGVFPGHTPLVSRAGPPERSLPGPQPPLPPGRGIGLAPPRCWRRVASAVSPQPQGFARGRARAGAAHSGGGTGCKPSRQELTRHQSPSKARGLQSGGGGGAAEAWGQPRWWGLDLETGRQVPSSARAAPPGAQGRALLGEAWLQGTMGGGAAATQDSAHRRAPEHTDVKHGPAAHLSVSICLGREAPLGDRQGRRTALPSPGNLSQPVTLRGHARPWGLCERLARGAQAWGALSPLLLHRRRPQSAGPGWAYEPATPPETVPFQQMATTTHR